MKTQEELQTKLDALGKIEPEQRNAIACVLIGHRRLRDALIEGTEGANE